MKRSIILVLSAITLLTSCNTDFRKTKGGVVYKIFHQGKSSDPVAKNNDIIKFNVSEKINDSLLGSTYGKMPQYAQVFTGSPPQYSPAEIFPMLRKNDSAIVVLSMDTLFKKGVAQMQFPFAKKGDKLTITYKILEVFHDDSTARADATREQAKDAPRQQKEQEEQMKKMEEEAKAKQVQEEKEIESWLTSKNIKATKTSKGTYLQVLEPGSGPRADSGKYVSFDYTGKTFEGKVFDSSIDTTFHHQTISYTVGGGMIPGLDDAIRQLKKGAHAIMYIPAAQGYAGQPLSADVGPWTNLVFDIYVRDVKDAPSNVVANKSQTPDKKVDANQKKK